MKKTVKIIIALVIAAIIAAAGWVIAEKQTMKNAPDFEPLALSYIQQAADEAYNSEVISENGVILNGLMQKAAENISVSSAEIKGRNAKARVDYAYLDEELLVKELLEIMPGKLGELVDAARLSSEIYDYEKHYLPEVFDRAFSDAAAEINADDCLHISSAYVDMKYSKGEWSIINPNVTDGIYSSDSDAAAERIIAVLAEELPYIPKHYTIPLHDTAAPAPDQSNFGTTSDTSVIEALIASPTAQQLINGQELAWNSSIEFLPGSEINYYLDETILMLQWKEVTVDAVGTYSEVIIADASQLKRKFAGDAFGDMNFSYASQLAQDTNSVIAYGGDLYNHARACGVVVYGGEIYRFEPVTCDTMYFDRNGDMLFSKRGEFTEPSQAEQLIAENGVDFSICFGPVLIEDGKDVTPESYPWGEINDTYARSAIGMLGKLHYFTVNINCQAPNYFYLATLQDATDAMMKHGCYVAYALDGGQTAETIVNGVMINPVQFGMERMVSDIIYFGTAIPEK